MNAPFTIILAPDSWESIRRGLERNPELIPDTMRGAANKILAEGPMITIDREVSGRFRQGELKVVGCDCTKVLCLLFAAINGKWRRMVDLGYELKRSLPGLKISDTKSGVIFELYGEKMVLVTPEHVTAGEVN